MRLRFIPAGAGNTTKASTSPSPLPVHPCRRREHSIRSVWLILRPGSSLQAQGTRTPACSQASVKRFIPAGAGNTTKRKVLMMFITVHPCRRREHSQVSINTGGHIGSSLQAQGTLSPALLIWGTIRFIPAGAGNTPVIVVAGFAISVHPCRRREHEQHFRFGSLHDRFIPAGAGNTVHEPVHLVQIIGSSLQAQGTLDVADAEKLSQRFIPAGAGNT